MSHSPSPPSPHSGSGPAKKALSVSVQYRQFRKRKQPPHELSHIHQDSTCIVGLLMSKFGYSDKDITVLKDDGSSIPPTRANILEAMNKLVADAKAGDHLVFHISGHGSQRLCPEPEQEQDGMDEMFWPVDVELDGDDVKNEILDDTIKEILVNNLQHGVNLLMIADCCHSGTIADLDQFEEVESGYGHVKHERRQKPLRIKDHEKINPGEERSVIPNVICWSACKDEQETYNPRESGGIFTRTLAHVIGADASRTHTEAHEIVTQTVERIMKGSEDALQLQGKNETPPRPQAHLSSLHPESENLKISETFGTL